jgi:hypothetical protein
LGLDEVYFVVVGSAGGLQGYAALVVDGAEGGEDVVEVGGAGAEGAGFDAAFGLAVAVFEVD